MRLTRHFVSDGFYTRAVSILICLMIAPGCRKGASEADEGQMVLRYQMITKIKSLDPGNVEDVYGMMIISQICEPLYTYHYLKRPFEIIPLLADGMPQISPDKLTYTIKIKKGIFYQDAPCFPDGKGREVRAGDFVYAIKRIANIRYVNVNWGGFKDKIVGLDEFRQYTNQFKKELDVDYSYEVAGLKALDDYTLQIILKKPWPQIIEIAFTDTSTAPVPREAVEYYNQEILYHPVGTGPYKLATWQRGFYIELTRNENFHPDYYPSAGAPGDAEAGLLADAGKRLPFADRIIWRIIEEEQPAWLLFLRGRLDTMYIPKDNFASAVDLQAQKPTDQLKKLNIRLIVDDQPSLYWLGFNMKDPLLGSNKPLREAISCAIDRRKQNELFYNNRWRIAGGLIHPLQQDYDPNLAGTGYIRYDPDRAVMLLNEAKKLLGGPVPPLTMACPGTDSFYRQLGQFFQQQFEQVGLKLKVDYMDWPIYLEKKNKGQIQILLNGVQYGSPDPIGIFSMFATKYFAPLGNDFFYSNPDYDKLFDQAEVMFPGPVRTALYRKMERMILADYPAAFELQRVQFTLCHQWYKNYKPHPFLYGYAKYIRVDTEQRNAYKKLLRELKKQDK